MHVLVGSHSYDLVARLRKNLVLRVLLQMILVLFPLKKETKRLRPLLKNVTHHPQQQL